MSGDSATMAICHTIGDMSPGPGANTSACKMLDLSAAPSVQWELQFPAEKCTIAPGSGMKYTSWNQGNVYLNYTYYINILEDA